MFADADAVALMPWDVTPGGLGAWPHRRVTFSAARGGNHAQPALAAASWTAMRWRTDEEGGDKGSGLVVCVLERTFPRKPRSLCAMAAVSLWLSPKRPRRFLDAARCDPGPEATSPLQRAAGNRLLHRHLPREPRAVGSVIKLSSTLLPLGERASRSRS